MNYRQAFLDRRAQFTNEARDKTLRELNELGVGTWLYEDGFYWTDIEEIKTIFIVRGNFEPYIFDNLSILPEDGFTLEATVYSPAEVAEEIRTYIEEQNADNEED